MKHRRMTLQWKLRCIEAAVFLVMLPVLWTLRDVTIAGTRFPMMAACMADLAVTALLCARVLLPKIPADGQPLALPADTLLSGKLQISGMTVPVERIEPKAIRPGTSMLLCANAAALLLPEDRRERDAVLLCLEKLRVAPKQVRSRMPLLREKEAYGLRWEIHQDGTGMMAYAAGTPEDILPVCTAMMGRRQLPLSHESGLAMMKTLQEERIKPLCFAMARVTESGIGEPVYLGAFLFEELMAPDTADELEELRQRGMQPFIYDLDAPALAEAMNRRLGCEAAPLEHSFVYEGEGGDRFTRVLRQRDFRRSRLLMQVIQTVTLLEVAAAVSMWLLQDPLLMFFPWAFLHFTAAACFPPESVSLHKERVWDLVRFGLCAVICSLAARYAGVYGAYCGISGGPVALAAILPWICRCLYSCMSQCGHLSAALRLAVVCVCAGFSLACLAVLGASLLGLGFGLAVGGFMAALLTLVLG